MHKVGRRKVLGGLAALSLSGCKSEPVNAPTGAAGSWATGGTASMKEVYPDPFATPPTAACQLTCSSTIGPCYATSIVRKDISEGHDGLPVRLALLVLDTQCRPLPNVEIDVWHSAPEGVYSGNDASPMCTNDDAKAIAARFFRGKQTTDSKGRVDFHTCFPGWYHGRTVHIHFTARLNGKEAVTSQLFFDDSIIEGITTNQVLYKERGKPDTTNHNDGVIGANEVKNYLFETTRMADGVMIARKAIILESGDGAVCATKGGTMGPPPGGPPPPGGRPPPGAPPPPRAAR